MLVIVVRVAIGVIVILHLFNEVLQRIRRDLVVLHGANLLEYGPHRPVLLDVVRHFQHVVFEGVDQIVPRLELKGREVKLLEAMLLKQRELSHPRPGLVLLDVNVLRRAHPLLDVLLVQGHVERSDRVFHLRIVRLQGVHKLHGFLLDEMLSDLGVDLRGVVRRIESL